MTAGGPQVAVVLPVYNGARYLSSCLESILGQTDATFEVVAADDGSTDGSADILRRVDDSRVRVLSNPSRLGLFPTLNRLVAASTAPLVKIVCQDDQLLPNCLRAVVAFMAEHPAAGMLFQKSVIVDAAGTEVRRDRTDDLPAELPPDHAAQQFLFHGCIPGNLSTVTMRRSAFDAVGGFDERFEVSGDYDLWTRLCRTQSLGVVQQHLVRLRSHDGQLSRQPASGAQCVAEDRRIRATLFERLPKDQVRAARAYEARRHNVLAWHFAVRALLAMRLAAFGQVVRTLGVTGAVQGCAHWVLTANNRWRRPAAPFRLPT